MAKRLKLKTDYTREQIKQEILETYSINQILDMLIDYVELDNQKEEQIKPITISPEDMMKISSLFKVRGFKESGEVETRGRKKIDSKD